MGGLVKLSSLPVPEEQNAPESVQTSVKELKAELLGCFKQIGNSDNVVTFAAMYRFPNPGLHLKYAGGIGLPLSDNDARTIIATSRQTPFGPGSKMNGDSVATNTWEIAADEFETKNPNWQAETQRIATKVSEKLGIVDAHPGGVSAELHKLSLYEAGGLFKLHENSEKSDRIFGTLVITLPSAHAGGDLSVFHAGELRHQCRTSLYSEFDATYLACLSPSTDIDHEIQPLSSGRRLVLIYNLMRTVTAPTKFVTDSLVIVSKLQEVLRQWNESIKKDILFPPTLAYQLNGHYTEASFSWGTLKLQDRLIVSHLRVACEALNISLFISTFERNGEGRIGRRMGQDAKIEPIDLRRIKWISEESKEILILHKV